MGSGTGTPVAQGAPALSPDANPQSNAPQQNLSLTVPPPGQEFNVPGEGFVTQTASELGIPDFDRGEFIFNPDLGGSEAQQRELFEFSADTFVPILEILLPLLHKRMILFLMLLILLLLLLLHHLHLLHKPLNKEDKMIFLYNLGS